MAGLSTSPSVPAALPTMSLRRLLAIVLACATAVIVAVFVRDIARVPSDDPVLVDSTLGQLVLWMADQSGEDEPASLFGQLGKSWAAAQGEAILDGNAAVDATRWPMVALGGAAIILVWIGARSQFTAEPHRRWWLLALACLISLLFLIPTLEQRDTLTPILMGGVLLLLALMISGGHVSRIVGFAVVLASLLIGVEVLKGFSASNSYKIVIPEAGWTYTSYESLDKALIALQAGEIRAVFGDANDLEARLPTESPDLAFEDLAIIDNIARDDFRLGLPVQPALPARFAVVVREGEDSSLRAIRDLIGSPVGVAAGDLAETNFLSQPRVWQLIDLRVFNNLNMPHLQSVAGAFMQPARRNGPVLLARILAGNAVYTWSEAALGFVSGAALGFVLGAVFAHSKLLERGLLPYVIASQTVPILAIAPMVVIWLGAGPTAVAVISAYLTFFPVTINTLRGLSSPQQTQIDLMRSYAASKWTIFIKLRLPAAVPYIFTALKVSATASVVGAIIGELPSSIREGLARAILDFSSSYSEVSTPKLYAAIVSAASVGILFFVIVSLIERVAMRRYIPHSE